MKEDKYEALRAKAEVLIEALPYIQRFNRRIIVVSMVEVPCSMKN